MSLNRVFVYGTLMRGQRANDMLKDSKYLGVYCLKDYGMFSCGSYPGIKEMKGDQVIGEVYEIDEEILSNLDRYEGEGSLYCRSEVVVANAEGAIDVYVYTYLGNVGYDKEIIMGKWQASESDKVWYACYGSNLSEDRFRCYVEGGKCAENGRYYDGCNDTTLWTDSKVKNVSGGMYFGNSSGSWGGKGVAFYDSSFEGEVVMRLYKLTWGQLLDIRKQEGSSFRWYGKIECLDVDVDDCPIYTLTSKDRVSMNAPSDEYINLIKKALINECLIPQREVEDYLDACLDR